MRNKIKKYLLPVIILLVAIPSFLNLFRSGYFPIHDDIQAFRLLEMDKCIKDGQFPCRWIPDMGYGYGYPQFNYYGPFPYYLMEAVHLMGFGFLDSTKIGFALSIFVSAVGMYLLGKSIWGKYAGLLASIFYVYAPYRAVNIYVRGAMGEAWGMAILPFIFWSTKELLENKWYASLWLALSIATLFTSHNITALIFIPFYLVWIAYLLLYKKNRRSSIFQNAKKIVLSGIWGFLLSAYFILPAYFEKSYVHIETLLMGYFNYLAHFVGLRQLLFSTEFGYGGSELGPNDDILLSPGIIHWIIPLLVLGYLFIKKSKETKLAGLFLGLGWLALFMIHPRSVLVWKSFNLLSFVQFPWRFLSIVSFFFSLVVGALLIDLPKYKLKKIVLFVLSLLVIGINLNYFKPDYYIDITDTDKFSGNSWQKQLTISIFDYLPINAELPPTEKAPDNPTIVDGRADIISGNKGSNWQDWKINVITTQAKVMYPVYYFPDWKAFVNGSQTDFTYDNTLGLITTTLNQGENTVRLKLFNTPLRTVSNWLTLISLFIIPVYVYQRKNSSKI